MPEVDRVSPGQRPEGPASGHQKWRQLLFIHWEVEPSSLRSSVPTSLELDAYANKYYVGIVPFLMEDIRPRFWPAGMGLNFLETNLRTYVTHRGVPGVFFFSLEASSTIAVKVARAMWSLPYFRAKMSSTRQGESVDYRSDRLDDPPARLETRFAIGSELPASEPGTLQHFLLERYYLFMERRGQLYRGQVHHVPYPAHRAELSSCEESLLEATGIVRPKATPDLVHYSPGVDVEVFGPYAVPQ